MADLHMEALEDNEVAEHIDQGLASLNARFEGCNNPELADAVRRACDAWDIVADLLHGFREA